jgi:uncharacterized protein with PIN domain
MEEQQLCSACGANLAGPFEPKVALTQASSNEESVQEALELLARSWVCVSCGLVHWYAEREALRQLRDAASHDEPTPPKPATSYERRAQVLRMLRRVRRM